MRIRPAEKDDLAELHRLERSVFGDHAYPAFFLRQAWDLWSSSLLIATDASGGITGYVLAGRGQSAIDGWLLSLAVAPRAQRKGLGRRLTEAAMEALRAQGCRRVWLTVEPASAARALYESLGFVEVGREPDYFGPGQTRVTMMRE